MGLRLRFRHTSEVGSFAMSLSFVFNGRSMNRLELYDEIVTDRPWTRPAARRIVSKSDNFVILAYVH